MNALYLSRIGIRTFQWRKACAGVAGICLALSSLAETPARLYPSATLPLQSVAGETTNEVGTTAEKPKAPELTTTGTKSKSESTVATAQPRLDGTAPGLEPVAQPVTQAPEKVATNGVPKNLLDLFVKKISLEKKELSPQETIALFQQKMEMARYLRTSRQAKDAEPLLIQLLSDDTPENIRQSALLELAAAAQDENEPARAQQIYAQFLTKWSNDPRVPEVLLRQGLLFRQMGLNSLALTKFYGVMTSALVLQNDQLDYYVHLVQQAQMEIAETHYALGKYTEAADFFSRLLKQNNSQNKSALFYKLVRCHSALNRYAETIADAQNFLTHFPNAPEQPEVRFHLALALKQLGRNNESLQQVLDLMREQRELTKDHPEVWAYWQQRAGNLIGNHLYSEGDYTKALEVYLSLAQLDSSPAWQLPVNYQIAMTYERLWQPQKAAEMYASILKREKDLSATASPSLKAVFEMAHWRMGFIDWHEKAENANRQFHLGSETNSPVTASLESSPVSIP